MINPDFIKSQHKVFEYTLSEGTKTSYSLSIGGSGILPSKLYLTNYIGSIGINKATYQIQGQYKKNDVGLYKDLNKGKVYTKIILSKDHPRFLGWGEVDARFKVYDLLVFSANIDKTILSIHLFRGLASPEYLEPVLQYLEKFTKDKSP